MQKTKLLHFSTTVVFALTVFLGAFLLFQVQPLIGRYLLPWFGGSPEVWTTCMLFFQIFLLAGYTYAHFLTRIRQFRLQLMLHIGLLAIALLFLPIIPKETFKPTSAENPIFQILLICSVTIGPPYLLLSATSPLVQAWFGRLFPLSNPYRLYALSNAGSLLALASFPFIFEPFLTRIQIVYTWSWTFGLFGCLCAAAVLLSKTPTALSSVKNTQNAGPERISSPVKHRWLWLALPAAGSVELLAVTNKITQDIAVIPFLWVLPLSVYLLSFIICFEHQRWYKRTIFVPLFTLGIIGVIYANLREEGMGVYNLIGIYVFMLFSCCMVCHGELYRLRPAARYLTGYYLIIAAGGAMGGFFVAVVCPLIFKVYIELYLGLLVCTCFLLLADEPAQPSALTVSALSRRPFWIAALLIVGTCGIFFMGRRTTDNQRAIANARNFFGVLTLWEEAWDDPENHKLLMQHGTTFHGLQFQSPEKKDIPTAYYSPGSGIGIVMQNWPRQDNRRIGIVGLGVGTIAIYGHPTDTIRFYEINPQVERMAQDYFTYLKDSPSDIEIVLGDARLSMEHESPQNYDILVLDAFSSDSVPVHLLTAEAIEIYLKHLAADGVLAFHISTMHLDLHSVVWKLAEHFGLQTAWIESYENEDTGALASDWILLARDNRFLGTEAIRKIATPPSQRRKDVLLWTDDHINLLQILKKSPLSR